MSYSVGVQNIFELLEDENDDQPDVRTPQTKLEETKKAPVNRQPPVGDNKPKAAQRDANQKKPVADAKLEGFTDVTSQKSRSPSTRNAGDRNRDNRGPRRDGDRPPRRDGDRPPRRDGDRPPREGGDRPREPREPREGGEQRTREPRAPREGREPREHRAPREDRPPREGREDRGPIVGQPKQDRDKEKYHREVQNAPYDGKTNKRTYDRHSGTGRNRTENKKGGAGGANWGSETDPKEELAAEGQVKEDAAADAKDESAVETPAEGETAAEPAVPEKKELSLAEYRKQREQSLAALPSLPTPRAAGEGVNDKEKDKWATEALKKENENKKAAARKEGEAAAEKKEKENKKATASLDQFFHIKPRERPKYDDREDRGDRADRPPRRDGDRPRREGDNRGPRNNKGEKGAKGEGAKKAPQGGAETQPIVKTDVDFPTLNTKA